MSQYLSVSAQVTVTMKRDYISTALLLFTLNSAVLGWFLRRRL